MAIKGGFGPGQIGLTLIVKDAGAAIAFYKDVFGAEEVQIDKMEHGDVSGAMLRVGGALLSIVIENPNLGNAPRPDWPRSPSSAGSSTAFFSLYVEDVDATMAKALAAGATLPGRGPAVQDTHWGDRAGQFFDPFGHLWRVQTSYEEVTFDDLPERFEALRRRGRPAA